MFVRREFPFAAARVRCALGVLLIAVARPGMPAVAAITTSGDVVPAYPPQQPDPWDIGGELLVGSSGHGTLTIADGGSVSNTVAAYLGYGGTGIVHVTGAGSTWTNTGNIQIGRYQGSGELTIAGGATVSNTTAFVGIDAGSSGHVLVTGSGSTWLNQASGGFGGGISVGQAGAASLTISNGGSVYHMGIGDSTIAKNGGSTGVVSVSGLGSLWQHTNSLYVGGGDFGAGGVGTLNVEDSGTVVIPGMLGIHPQGTVNLVGGTLRAASITANGNFHFKAGTLAITGQLVPLVIDAGGLLGSSFLLDASKSLQVGHDLIVGHQGTGTLAVLAGSAVSNTLYVGNNGTGSLIVSDGGNVVTTQNGYIGNNPSASGMVTVAGSNSSWTNSFLAVGNFGPGSLVITNGGRVHTTFTGESSRIGNGPSTGSVLVSGLGSSWTNAGSLIVGQFGTGTLTIAGGANVSNTFGAIASLPGSSGTVTVTGTDTLWENSASLFVGGNSSQVGGEGTLNISNGGTVNVANTLLIREAGTVNLNGGTVKTTTLNLTAGVFHMTGGRLVANSVVGNLTIAGGTLAPGDSPGVTAISGNYTQQSGAALEIELGGATPGQFDSLAISGQATLAGSLAVLLVDLGSGEFSPAPGQSFSILTAAGGISGQFTTLVSQLPELGEGLSWFIRYLATSVVLQVVAGDYNQDGVVDAADYVLWRRDIGTSAAYDAWRAHFGQPVGSASATGTAVPEPLSLELLLVGLAVVLIRNKRETKGVRNRLS